MVTIKISTANEAFDTPGIEIARILRDLADKIDIDVTNGESILLRDINGNAVGSFKYTDK